MTLNRATVGTLFRTELRMLLRDRRTVITSILLPMLIMPVMLLATSGMKRLREKTLDETIYQYAVTGSEADAVREFIAVMREERAARDEPDADADGTFQFQEVEVDDVASALEQKTLHFYIEGQTAEEARAERAAQHEEKNADAKSEAPAKEQGDSAPAPDENWREPVIDGAPVVRLVYRADRDDSQSGMRRMRDALRDARAGSRDVALQAHGVPVDVEALGPIEMHNLATAGQVAGLSFGRLITLLVLMLIMSGCAVAATDSLAGEKERGTLETLLTTAATRLEIILAKHLAVLVVAIAIALIQAANLIVYLGFELIPVPANFAEALPPGVAVLLFVLFLPLTALAASVMLLTSGYAKTYKEAQLYFMPVFFAAAALAAASFLPNISLRSVIVLLPVSNIAIAAREILTGTFDWPLLAVAWLVTAAAAVGVTRLSVKVLATEKLITATDTDAVDFAGGPALFRRVVLRWFAVMWALILIISNYTAAADMRLQVTINLVLVFFGGSLLMWRRYRLDLRSTFALRAPRPAVWLAVVFAVPSAILAGVGAMYLSNLLFPVSPEFLRDMAEAFQFDHIPTWQLVVFIGIFPGVFEELAFRGALLHGLHRRLHPALLVLVVGVIFGLFHFALPRIIPTAYIGLLLTATVLLTGSIYPAMFWHAASNILMVLYGESVLEVVANEPLYALAGAVALALCFLVLWRNRTPYPGLRPWRRSPR